MKNTTVILTRALKHAMQIEKLQTRMDELLSKLQPTTANTKKAVRVKAKKAQGATRGDPYHISPEAITKVKRAQLWIAEQGQKKTSSKPSMEFMTARLKSAASQRIRR